MKIKWTSSIMAIVRPWGRKKIRKELYLQKELLDFIVNDFPKNHTEGVERCISTYKSLLKSTIAELHGYFTKEEISTLISFQTNRIVEKKNQDSAELYVAQISLEIKKGNLLLSNSKKTIDKISRLTAAQAFFLQEAIELAWHLPVKKNAIDMLIEDLKG